MITLNQLSTFLLQVQGRRQKAEGRRQKAEGRRQKAEIFKKSVRNSTNMVHKVINLNQS